ncbi:hypothetical protein ABW20_dc0104424 [Dactylellina cionopaga]|nr:hypothetical protein ABW20_dc0104424 [Dactylellina cionopaga]
MFSDDEEYFAYYDPWKSESMYAALLDLERYIEVEGPFDGIIAFSLGAAMSSSLLLGRAASSGGKWKNPFKCAIFFAAGIPWSFEALQKQELIRLNKDSKERQEMSAVLESLCSEENRYAHYHYEGHTIPGRRSPETLAASMKVIRRVLWDVEAASV